MKKEEIFNIFYGKETWEIYKEFQKIENRIEETDELYQYFDEIKEMLVTEKSYIKMRGFTIICKLSKWDKDNKIDDVINSMLDVLDDEKPTIVRMCLKALNNLISYKTELSDKIKNKLETINYLKFKDTMSPLIKKDIESVLENL